MKAHRNGERVTRFNALFHWAVPPGHEISPSVYRAWCGAMGLDPAAMSDYSPPAQRSG